MKQPVTEGRIENVCLVGDNAGKVWDPNLAEVWPRGHEEHLPRLKEVTERRAHLAVRDITGTLDNHTLCIHVTAGHVPIHAAIDWVDLDPGPKNDVTKLNALPV